MKKADFSNAFAKFANHEVKVAYIKALDAEVKYRELTMAEVDVFSKRMIKGYGEDNRTPEIDFDEANEIKYEKAAMILVEPKITVKELKALPAAAIEAINEINALVDGDEADGLDEKGN
jgi:hypothetical protein